MLLRSDLRFVTELVSLDEDVQPNTVLHGLSELRGRYLNELQPLLNTKTGNTANTLARYELIIAAEGLGKVCAPSLRRSPETQVSELLSKQNKSKKTGRVRMDDDLNSIPHSLQPFYTFEAPHSICLRH